MISRHPERTRMQEKKAAQSKNCRCSQFLENGGWHSGARLPEAKNQVGHAHDNQRNSPKKTINRQKDQGNENSQKQQEEPNEKEGDFMYFENFMSP